MTIFKTANVKRLIKRIRSIIHRKGLTGLFYQYLNSFKISIKIIFNLYSNYISSPFHYWCCYYYRNFKSFRTLKANGKKYKYFYHNYNTTWKNERAVEIPIIWEFVKHNYNNNILEVGNVLSNYFKCNHDILDKYEQKIDIIKQDVVDYNISKKYELIVSISTIEHVGWNETPREPEKILRAIDHLKSLLTPYGKIVITVPIGWNSYLDQILDNGKLKFTKQICLKRISKSNKWKEVKWNKIRKAKYGVPISYSANGLVIGVIEKD